MLPQDLMGEPYPKRKQLIAQLLESKNQAVYDYPLKFQNQLRPFNVFKVPIGMPKYRLTNGRTQAYQQIFLAQNPTLPKDYFETDLEVITKHQKQHDILKILADKDSLAKYFEKEIQDRPLIIDQDGFVINGNRRLCAMRELYNKDATEYSRFSHIDVLILPPCDEKDKDELEADLQIKKDMKQDYDWVSEGFMYRKRMEEYGYSLDTLAKLYGKKKSEIAERLVMLNYAEEYLVYIGKEKQYNLVMEDAEYAFQAIYASRKKHGNKSEAHKNILKDVNYIVLKASQDNNDLGFGRVYNTINKISEHFTSLVDNLDNEMAEEIEAESDNEVQTGIELFGISEDKEKKLASLSKVIAKPENKEKVLAGIKDTIDRQEILKKEKQNARAAFNLIQKAHNFLADALSVLDNNSDITGISEQLNQIQKIASDIREKV